MNLFYRNLFLIFVLIFTGNISFGESSTNKKDPRSQELFGFAPNFLYQFIDEDGRNKLDISMHKPFSSVLFDCPVGNGGDRAQSALVKEMQSFFDKLSSNPNNIIADMASVEREGDTDWVVLGVNYSRGKLGRTYSTTFHIEIPESCNVTYSQLEQ